MYEGPGVLRPSSVSLKCMGFVNWEETTDECSASMPTPYVVPQSAQMLLAQNALGLGLGSKAATMGVSAAIKLLMMVSCGQVAINGDGSHDFSRQVLHSNLTV